MSPEDRVARAMAAAAAYHRRRADGAAEPVEEFLADCGDLRELVAPMLDVSMSMTSATGAGNHADVLELDRFGHFRLLSRLGQGGMGTVHLALDESLDRQVALKQIRPENLDSLQARARFEREARAVSRLDHPNLCQVFYTGEDSGIPYLVMQYVEGETLKTRIQRARAGESTVLAGSPSSGSSTGSATPSTKDEIHGLVRLVEKAARALHHAHEFGLVHRDIKPGNIMVKADGDPVVLDFGLVREEDTDLTLTDSLQQLGTPLYMAPEQIVSSGVVDRRTDVYALGTTLYECLTLQPPFEGETRQELFDHILKDEPPSAHRANRRVPRDLAVVVAKAMDKDPARRFQTALELAEDLARVRTMQPIRARPAGPVLRLQRWMRRNPTAASLIVAITGGLVVSLYLLGERNVAMAQATTHLDNFLRLGIRPRLDTLKSDAEKLHPPWPESIDAMRSWVRRSEELRAELPRMQAALDELRTRALPLTEEDRVRQERLHPALRLVNRLEAGRMTWAKQLDKYAGEVPSPQRDELRRAVEAFDARVAKARKALEERWVYRFVADSDQFLHDALFGVTEELSAFLDPDGGAMARVERDLAWAAKIETESIEKPAARWREAIEAIAASDDRRASKLYGGMRLTPQYGLVPLGMDPESKLWEFHHLRSGSAPDRDPDTGRLRVTGENGIVFVLIPGGSFWMGAQGTDRSARNYDALALPNEAPVHEVTLDPFFLAKHEMTQGQWQRLSRQKNPSGYWAPSKPLTRPITWAHPVEMVSWEMCEDLLRKNGLLLPTESQWEYACRAGTTTPWWTGPDRDSLKGAVNLADKSALQYFPPAKEWPELDDGFVVHAPVDAFRPNPFGLHLMNSNVAEWCRDTGEVEYTAPVAPGDGLRTSTVRDKRIRGATYADGAGVARSTMRIAEAPTNTTEYTGVRAARAVIVR